MKKSKLITVFAVALSACILVACFPKGYTDKEEKAQINAAVKFTEKYSDEYAPDAYISKSDFCVLDRQAEGNPKLYLTDWAEGKFKDSKNHKNYSVYVNTKTGEVYTDHNWDEVDSYGRKLFYEQFGDAYKMNFTLLGFLTLPYKDGDNSFGDITLSKMLPGDEETNESFVKDVFFGSDYEMTYYVDVSEDCDMDMFRNADISALGKKARLLVRQYSADDFYKRTSGSSGADGPEFIDETKVLATYDSDCPDEEKTKNSSEDNKQSDGDVPELTEDIYDSHLEMNYLEEVDEYYIRGLADLMADMKLAYNNGYYMKDNASDRTYYLNARYESGEELTIRAEGRSADNCFFDIPRLMDYAAIKTDETFQD